MTRLTVDRIPPIILALLLLAQYAGAEYFVRTAGFITVSPFSPMWASYDPREARSFVSYALIGIGLALLVPLGRGMPVSELVRGTRDVAARLSSLWLIIALVALALMTYVKLPYILYAPEYLMTQGPAPLASLSTIMGPLAALAAGALSSRRPAVGAVLAVAVSVLLFAGATRVSSAVPLLFVVGRYISGGRVKGLWAVIAVVFAYVTLPIPLISRSQHAHGLIPYWAAVGPAIMQPDYLSDVGRTFGENVGMTIPLMLFVSHFNITPNDMVISLNPLPAHMAGWDQILAQMRVHDFIPFSALGEWATFGPIYLMGFVFVWSIIVRLCVGTVARNPTILMLPLVVLTIALSSLTVLEMGQYNTRAIARLVDMLILVAIGDRVTRSLQKRILPTTLDFSPDAERTQITS